MNKKILVLSITLLTLVMLTTPLVSARGVRRNVSQDFTATVRMCDPFTNPQGAYVPGTSKYFGPKDSAVPLNPDNPENRKYRMNKGGLFFGVITHSVLGKGTMTSIPIIGIMDQEAGEGFGIFKWKLEFNNPTCKGSIAGIYKGEQTIAPPNMLIQGSALMCKGTGDLKNVKILVTSYEATLGLSDFFSAGFDAIMEGKMWGWT